MLLSSRELNAYVRQEADDIAPKAFHNLQLSFTESGLTATAQVDFLELNKVHGGESHWLVDRILYGERPVKVTLRVQTHASLARVDLERLEIAGAALEGAALKFLVDRYVMSEFPEAKISQWFRMSYRIDHLESKATGVTVAIGR